MKMPSDQITKEQESTPSARGGRGRHDSERPIIHMTWRHLLFVHWPIPFELARRIVPPALEVDTFDGQAWIGLVPFTMTNVQHRPMSLPFARHFHECNVRTYARYGKEHGVWFCTLDATSRLAVLGARMLWRLNYRRARINLHARAAEDDTSDRSAAMTVDYAVTRLDHQRRTHFDQHAVDHSIGHPHLRCRWHVGDALPRSQPGELLHFLTERYALFACSRHGEVRKGRIEHEPWPLRAATIEQLDQSLLSSVGVPAGHLDDSKRIVVAADPITVQGYPLRTLPRPAC